MNEATDAAYAEKLELYEKLVATNPRVERKGAGFPYTSLNGHMFSILTKAGQLGLRLPAEAREKFLKQHKTSLLTQFGVVQKEYVVVSDALLKNTRELKKYFDQSHAYVGSLKPKPTAKKAKKRE